MAELLDVVGDQSGESAACAGGAGDGFFVGKRGFLQSGAEVGNGGKLRGGANIH